MNETMTNEMLLDEDGIVHLVERRVVRKVALADLVQTVMSSYRRKCFNTPVLPGIDGSCRIYTESDRSVGFLMQVNPGVRTIRFQNKRGRNPARAYRQDTTSEDVDNDSGQMFLFDVSMPWLWVMCKFLKVEKGVYQWWRCFLCSTYRNIDSLKDPVFFAPVPNQWPSGHMCTGDVMDDSLENTDKPSLLCRKWLFKIWQSHFNDDLEDVQKPSSIANLGGWLYSLDRWEHMTKDNPSIGLSRDFGLIPYSWGKTDGTLDSFIERTMSGEIDEH